MDIKMTGVPIKAPIEQITLSNSTAELQSNGGPVNNDPMPQTDGIRQIIQDTTKYGFNSGQTLPSDPEVIKMLVAASYKKTVQAKLNDPNIPKMMAEAKDLEQISADTSNSINGGYLIDDTSTGDQIFVSSDGQVFAKGVLEGSKWKQIEHCKVGTGEMFASNLDELRSTTKAIINSGQIEFKDQTKFNLDLAKDLLRFIDANPQFSFARDILLSPTINTVHKFGLGKGDLQVTKDQVEAIRDGLETGKISAQSISQDHTIDEIKQTLQHIIDNYDEFAKQNTDKNWWNLYRIRTYSPVLSINDLEKLQKLIELKSPQTEKQMPQVA